MPCDDHGNSGPAEHADCRVTSRSPHLPHVDSVPASCAQVTSSGKKLTIMLSSRWLGRPALIWEEVSDGRSVEWCSSPNRLTCHPIWSESHVDARCRTWHRSGHDDDRCTVDDCIDVRRVLCWFLVNRMAHLVQPDCAEDGVSEAALPRRSSMHCHLVVAMIY